MVDERNAPGSSSLSTGASGRVLKPSSSGQLQVSVDEDIADALPQIAQEFLALEYVGTSLTHIMRLKISWRNAN